MVTHISPAAFHRIAYNRMESNRRFLPTVLGMIDYKFPSLFKKRINLATYATGYNQVRTVG